MNRSIFPSPGCRCLSAKMCIIQAAKNLVNCGTFENETIINRIFQKMKKIAPASVMPFWQEGDAAVRDREWKKAKKQERKQITKEMVKYLYTYILCRIICNNIWMLSSALLSSFLQMGETATTTGDGVSCQSVESVSEPSWHPSPPQRRILAYRRGPCTGEIN